jgi:hypothetical protein
MSRRDAEPVEIAATVIRVAERSVWVNDGTRAVSLPKSLISVEGVDRLDDLKKGRTYTFTVPEWKAQQEGLI